MSIEDEARAEAEKRFPVQLPYNRAFEQALQRREVYAEGYIAGAQRKVTETERGAADLIFKSDWLAEVKADARREALQEAADRFEATTHAWGKQAMIEHLRALADKETS